MTAEVGVAEAACIIQATGAPGAAGRVAVVMEPTTIQSVRRGEPASDSASPIRRAFSGELTVSLVFFASGAAGLIFEVVWFHRCGLVFGNSVWSTSIVLASFMGGLALGNAVIGAYGDRITRFLRAYAVLEVIVAVTGVALTYALPQLTWLLVPAARRLSDTWWLLHVVRLVTAFAVLTVPATAMGATLPVLVAALCRGRGGFGRALGRLYGWNTLGAVAGVVAAEMLLIARLGVTGSAWFAAALNLGAAATALWMSHRAGEDTAVTGHAPAAAAPPARQVWRLLAGGFLAGGALLALEVVWFRFLSMFVINSTLAVSLMLAVVLAAIGLGGVAAATWLERHRRAPEYLPAVALAAGCASAISYEAFQFLTTGTQVADWHRILWLACSLALPTALLSSVLFTLLGEALVSHLRSDTRAAGWLTLANTTGAMCGSLVATFVLLPALGMERAFFALAAVYGAVALLTMGETPAVRSTAAGRVFVAVAVAAVVVLARFPFGLMAGRYFVRSAQPYASDGSRIVATREGPTETIFLMQHTWLGKPIYQRLVTNGFSMSATDLTGSRYMRYFVYWPMLVHQTPLRRALVISYGVGRTAAAVTDVDSIEAIDVVEISRDVAAMSDIIYPADEHPLHDRRVRLHLEDGRQFLQMSGERYDLITGEPPPPLTPGTVNLYTREYFQLIYDRLAEGGISTYWLPVARRTEYEIAPIIRAFCDVFADCSLWNGTVFDWMLVGTRQARGPSSAAEFSRAWTHPVLAPHLREIGFEMPEQIGATFMGDADYLNTVTARTPPLTDDFPQRLLARAAASAEPDSRRPFDRGLSFFRTVVDTDRARRAFEASPLIRHLWPQPLIEATLPYFDYQRIINRLMAEPANPLRYIEELHDLLTKTSFRRLPLWELGSNDVIQQLAGTGDDGTGMVEYMLGVRALVARNYPAAAAYLAEAERRGLRAATTRPLLVYALCLAGNVDEARQLAPAGNPASADERHFWTFMASRFGVGPSR
jgi:spermidine synthase